MPIESCCFPAIELSLWSLSNQASIRPLSHIFFRVQGVSPSFFGESLVRQLIQLNVMTFYYTVYRVYLSVHDHSIRAMTFQHTTDFSHLELFDAIDRDHYVILEGLNSRFGYDGYYSLVQRRLSMTTIWL